MRTISIYNKTTLGISPQILEKNSTVPSEEMKRKKYERRTSYLVLMLRSQEIYTSCNCFILRRFDASFEVPLF